MASPNEVEPYCATCRLSGIFGVETQQRINNRFLDVHATVGKPPCVGGPRPLLFRIAMPSSTRSWMGHLQIGGLTRITPIDDFALMKKLIRRIA